jgi:hypothetical protein
MKRKKKKGIVLIQEVDQYFLNGKLVDYDEVTKNVDTVIILPAKNSE